LSCRGWKVGGTLILETDVSWSFDGMSWLACFGKGFSLGFVFVFLQKLYSFAKSGEKLQLKYRLDNTHCQNFSMILHKCFYHFLGLYTLMCPSVTFLEVDKKSFSIALSY